MLCFFVSVDPQNWYGGGSGERGGAWEEDGGFKKK